MLFNEKNRRGVTRPPPVFNGSVVDPALPDAGVLEPRSVNFERRLVAQAHETLPVVPGNVVRQTGIAAGVGVLRISRLGQLPEDPDGDARPGLD